MTVEPAGAGNASGATVQAATAKQLDRNAFMKLLITQLRHQDPLRPMQDTEFIAQLAQFSSLEQMQAMNENLSSSAQNQAAFQAVSLIGREIETVDPATGARITARVESVSFDSGTPLLRADGKDIPLSYVLSVR